MNKERSKEVQAYLKQIKRYDALIESKQEDILYLNEMATKITAAWGGEVVSGSRKQDKIGDILVKKHDLEHERAELIKKRDEIKAIIESVPNTEQMKILRLVYVGSWDAKYKCFRDVTWEEVGELRHMSPRNAQIIHGNALESVDKLLSDAKSFR